MANTQNFRVKHGLEVVEAATFSDSVTIQSDTTISNGYLNVTYGAQGPAFRASAANATHNRTLSVNTDAVGITGNLYITANTEFRSTATMGMGTGNLVLYSTLSGSDDPSGNAVITINRGSSSNVRFYWDESTANWKFTNDGIVEIPLISSQSLMYKFSTVTTTNADPGNGIVRFNNGTYASVTEIALDLLQYSGDNVSGLIDALDDYVLDKPDRCYLMFRSASTPSKFVVFKLTADVITSTSGVRRLTVAHVAGGASTFAANEILFVSYSVVGERGYQGFQGPLGYQGPQGYQGPTGAQGLQGPLGLQGFQGPQGYQGYQGVGYSSLSSTSSVTINTGTKTFTVNTDSSLSAMSPGLRVRAASVSTPTNYVEGYISSYSGTTLSISADTIAGLGSTYNSWSIFAPGTLGPQGFQGLQGNLGPQGLQGPLGLQGLQGPLGLQGLQGPLGLQGLQGPLGYQGAQGFQGNQGYQGPLGYQGFQGFQGFQGYQGPQGPLGYQGYQGNQGPTGAQGPRGYQGPQGPLGYQGPTGAQGAQGNQGPQGPLGYQGPTGAQGAQGNQGYQGYQGPLGLQGYQGFQGLQGFQGNQGNLGNQGYQGLTGLTSGVNANVNSLGVGTASHSSAGEIRASGDIISGYSDARLKTNVITIDNALDIIDSIRGVYYNQNATATSIGYKDDSRRAGVIAQEVQAVFPEAVKPAPFDLNYFNESKSGEGYLTVQYEKLIPVLIEGIKELRKKIQ